MPNWNRDDIARIIIAGGKEAGITERGIVIALSVGLVESNLTVYANAKVPGSLNLRHDAVGSDGMSVGVQQQQVIMSSMGWWWGPVEACQDPVSSTRLFFQRLARLDYNNTSRSPGSYAQQVQQSAYPDRYDQRITEAQALYDRLAGGTVPATPAYDYGITKVMHGFNPTTPANATGNSNGPRAKTLFAVCHTQEGDGTAVSLANYLNNNKVSYNIVVDSTDTVEVVPVDQGPWAAMAANNIAFHLCFAGSRAGWNRDTWLAKDAMLKRGAKAVAAACKQFDIPAVKVLSTNGWPVTPKGIAGHTDFGQRGGGHTDPGPGFPWPEFIQMVQDNLGTPTTPEVPVDRKFPDDFTDRELLLWIIEQLGVGHPDWPSKGMTLRDKVWSIAGSVK